MSIIQQTIARADTETRYLSPGEMDQIKDFLMSGDRRLKLVKALTESRDFIIKKAANELFQGQPNLVSPGGNAYGASMTATCLRDMDYYLRLVTYSVATGETSPMQDIGVIGARQMYQSLGTPVNAVAESIAKMKTIAMSLISAEDAGEVGGYFDYLVKALQR
ncbi:allophycocyanin [filamentous cyanobacterium CCP5]|nr:allophycocyanin [filamentous cyanobacterium CCP5]